MDTAARFLHQGSSSVCRPRRIGRADRHLLRELANRVRRGLVLAEGRQIQASDLGLQGLQAQDLPMGTLEDYKHRAERQALCDVLNRHSDNLSVAARVLGISRPTFYRLLHKHQIR